MENTFNTLIESFMADKVGIAENFLSNDLSKHLQENLMGLYNENQLRAAGTGNDPIISHNKEVRSDMIYWLDRKHNSESENGFFDIMDHFVSYLNESCYTGITGYEFHYALYEKGSFYKKHVDQFRSDGSRQYTLITYLNDNWKTEDGGELCIHHPGSIQSISPESGKTVFFKSSELPHEVLVTNKPRMSITGWLKK